MVGLRQIEMGADIGGILLDVSQKQSHVSFKLVRFASAIIAIVNVKDLIGNAIAGVSAPVFMGRPHTLPRIRAFHEPRVEVFDVTIGLDRVISVLCHFVVTKGIRRDDHHVGIYRHRIGGRGIP